MGLGKTFDIGSIKSDELDAEKAIAKREIWRRTEKWMERLGLQNWTVSHEFFDEHPKGVVADTVCQWQYMSASIRWDVLACTRASKVPGELDSVIVHELVHFIIDPIAPSETDEREEFVVTMLTKALVKAYRPTLVEQFDEAFNGLSPKDMRGMAAAGTPLKYEDIKRAADQLDEVDAGFSREQAGAWFDGEHADPQDEPDEPVAPTA